MSSVYVEHPRQGKITDIAFNDFQCAETVTKCSGEWYHFLTEKDAIEFIWRLRRMTARYVEIHQRLVPALKAKALAEGYSDDIDGLVSKVLP